MTTAVWAAKCRVATGMSAPLTATSAMSPSGRGSTAANPAKTQRPEDGPRGPAQHPGDERPEVGLDEEDGGGGQPVPVLVLPVPLGVVQRLCHGDAGPEAEGDPQPVLAAAGPEAGAQQAPRR